MARRAMGIARRSLLAVGIAAALTACAVDPASVPGLTATPTDPCGAGGGTTLALGPTSIHDERFATFTTDGSGVWVATSGYSYGGLFEPPEGEGHSSVYLGPASTPPQFDEQTAKVANVLVETTSFDGWWTWVALPAGEFWIASGGGIDLGVRSCRTDGVANGVPAPLILGPGATWQATNPCEGDWGVSTELGDPRLQSDTWAAFSTDGSDVWVTAQGYRHETILDPEVGAGAVYIGKAEDQPTYVPDSWDPSSLAVLTPLREGGWTLVVLPAGDYWLTATDAADIVISSCHAAGVTGASPAPSTSSSPTP